MTWPSAHLSEAFSLQTGFTCTRVCHWCNGQDRGNTNLVIKFYSILFWPTILNPKPQEWHRMDENAPWKQNRPGPYPFKGAHPFVGKVPGSDDPYRIKPDIVHTFHIGFGADLCASMIVWFSLKGCFGNQGSFDDRLVAAYFSFQTFCHNMHRYTSCEP